MITQTEIQNEFAVLTTISWSDYCELCSRENAEREVEEARRAGHIDEDESEDVAATVVAAHFLQGADWGQRRISEY